MRRIELTDEEFTQIKCQFDQFDKGLTGQLNYGQVKDTPVQIRGVTIDALTFNSIDVDRRGCITLLEVLRLLHPHVAVKDLQRFTCLELTADQIRKYQAAFKSITHGIGKLFTYDLDKAGEQVCGMKFSVKRLKRIKDHEKGISLVQTLHYLFPRIPVPLLQKYTASEITREEYILLMNDWKALQVDCHHGGISSTGGMGASNNSNSGDDSVSVRSICKSLQAEKQDKEGKLLEMKQQMIDSLYPQEDINVVVPPPCRNLGGVPFTLEMFCNIDKQQLGYITLDDVLRILYPCISPEALQYYSDSYTQSTSKSKEGKITATTNIANVAKSFTDFKKAQVTLINSWTRESFEAQHTLPVYQYQTSFWQYPHGFPRFDFEAWRSQSVWDEIQRRKQEEQRRQAEILYKIHTAAALLIQRTVRKWIRHKTYLKRAQDEEQARLSRIASRRKARADRNKSVIYRPRSTSRLSGTRRSSKIEHIKLRRDNTMDTMRTSSIVDILKLKNDLTKPPGLTVNIFGPDTPLSRATSIGSSITPSSFGGGGGRGATSTHPSTINTTPPNLSDINSSTTTTTINKSTRGPHHSSPTTSTTLLSHPPPAKRVHKLAQSKPKPKPKTSSPPKPSNSKSDPPQTTTPQQQQRPQDTTMTQKSLTSTGSPPPATPSQYDGIKPKARAASSKAPRIGAFVKYLGTKDELVTIHTVKPGGSAHTAGALPGDQIKVWEGATIDCKSKFEAAVRRTGVGNTATVIVHRSGHDVTLKIEVVGGINKLATFKTRGEVRV